ncbi:MAG: ASCH domain-containing protein [Alphaproteobacteria bacterium]|nr:ASCH domain-containing protein [Alphaproteobacteria bacterium]
MIDTSNPQNQAFWKQVCQDLDLPADTPCWTSGFAEPGQGPHDATKYDCIAALAFYEYKKGTCHQKAQFEHDNVPLRKVGDYSLVTTGAGAPVCVVRITNIDIKPFNEVSETFALSEGEGDFTAWTDGHRGYFEGQCKRWGTEFRPDTLAVCESFELVYRPR